MGKVARLAGEHSRKTVKAAEGIVARSMRSQKIIRLAIWEDNAEGNLR